MHVEARRRRARRCRPAGRRRPRRRTPPAAASARPARTCGPSCGGSACPACRPAPCSRRTSTTQRARRVAEQVAVDAADAGDQAVGRRALDQLLDRCAAGAARRSPARRTRRTCRGRRGRRCSRAPCAGRSCAGARPRRAARRRASSAWRSMHLGEVGADRVEVDLARVRGSPPRSTSPSLDEGERVALEHRVAHGDRDLRARRRSTGAAMTCSIFIASMTSSSWPARTASPSRDVDADDRALHRRARSATGARRGAVARRRRRERRAAAARRLPVREHRQRIARVDLGAGQAGAAGRRRCAAPACAACGRAARPACSSTKRGVTSFGHDAGMPQQALQERRRWSARPRSGTRRARGTPWRATAASVAGRRVHDQLGQQRVEARAGAVAGVAEGVDADARARTAARTP